VGAWSAVELVISHELLMMIIRGAQAPGEQWRMLLKGNPSDWRRPLLVTISRPGPDLNPHGPDLRKPVQLGPCWTLSHGISAGQALLAMCPRPDTHLTYTINIALTTEFTLTAGGAR
jgi:hypothetical protein